MDEWITPHDLARELRMDPKRVRDHLREWDPAHPKYARWLLDPVRAESARRFIEGRE